MKKTTKKVFNFITLGGATIAGMVSLGMPEITLIEWIGIYTGSRLLGEKLKFNEIKSQNSNELRETFKSSAFLAAGSLGAHVLAKFANDSLIRLWCCYRSYYRSSWNGDN